MTTPQPDPVTDQSGTTNRVQRPDAFDRALDPVTDLITDEMVEAAAGAILPFDPLEKRHFGPWDTAPIAVAVLTAALPLSPLYKETERLRAVLDEQRFVKWMHRAQAVEQSHVLLEHDRADLSATIERQAAEIERKDDEIIMLRGVLKSIAQYDPRFKGQHVNDAPSRDKLIARAFDALAPQEEEE